MNMSEIKKMKIWGTPAFAGNREEMKKINSEVTYDLFKNIFGINMIYLKPVKHCGMKMPVTLIKDDFTQYIKRSLPGHNFDDMRVNFFRKPDKRDLYEAIFGRKFFEGLLRSGGACTLPYAADINTGIYGNKSEFKVEGLDFGFIILIDTSLSKCTNLQAIIHHEYYHAMKSCGFEENIIKELTHFDNVKDMMEKYGNISIINAPEEEKEADEFAYINTGFRINIRKLIWNYFPEQARLSALQAAIFRVEMIPTFIKSGRRWLF